MRLATAIVNVLALATALRAGARVELLPPPSKLVRELTVQQWRRPEVERIDKADTYTLELQCAHVPGKTVPLIVEVTEQVLTPTGEPSWQDRTPEQLMVMAPAAEPQAVRFVDVVAAAEPRAAGLALPGGVQTASAFRTAGGLLCLVPEDRAEARALASSALPGDRLRICGHVLMLPGGVRCVAVTRIEPASVQPAPPPVRWVVTARSGGRDVAAFSVPGAYPVNVPCPHQAGAMEVVLLRLTEVRHVALAVQGHPVDAELADTPETRSWGLQGRSGLAEGTGMLFFFPQEDRPTFVMKTVSFPLSIAFIRADGTIVHIARLNPGDRHEATPPVPVNYVLEMPQGWFAARGIGPGSRVVMP